MHSSVMAWVASKVPDLTGLGGTLEVGSYDVNGSVRSLFVGSYIGVDMREGPQVDQIAQASALPFPPATFSTVVSTEMLEHDPTPWLSVPEMARVLRPGGHLLLTARGIGFPLHDYPSDYWRFTPAAFDVLFRIAGLEPIEIIDDPEASGVFGVAMKLNLLACPKPLRALTGL